MLEAMNDPEKGSGAADGMRSGSSAGAGRVVAFVVLGAWVLLSVIVASQNYVEHLLVGSHVSFALQGVWMLAVLSYWVLAVPLILWLYRRFPFEPGQIAKVVGLHLVFSAVLTALHAPVAIIATVALEPFPLPEGLGFFKALMLTFVYSFHTGFLLYWIVLGSGAAHDSWTKARDKELKSARLEAELGRARLEALESQIHPHFLFNALNTIAMMVREGDSKRAVDTIVKLGDLLRESLRRDPEHEVSLAEEMELVDRYLHVERCRFGDRLQVETSIPESLGVALVPHLVLQPLVENAVRHGIARSVGGGLIRIEAREDDDRLILEVHDNGPGLKEEKVANAHGGLGIGLENVRVRIEQLYGERGSCGLFPRPEEGTVARIVIPHRSALDVGGEVA